MDKRFIMTQCRFHAIDRTQLFISGWFTKGDETSNKITVLLDQEHLEYRMEKEINTGVVLMKVEPGQRKPKYMYRICVSLPKNWEQRKELKLVITDPASGVQYKDYSTSVSKLKKMKKNLECGVKSKKYDTRGFAIKGWCLRLTYVDIVVKDERGRELPVEIRNNKNAEAFYYYPECREENIFGFEIRYKGELPRAAYVYMKDGDRSSKYGITLKETKVKKVTQKIKKYQTKSMIYLKEYGIQDVVERAKMKLSKKEFNLYEHWRRIHIPDEKELQLQRKKEFGYSPKFSIVVPLYKTDHTFLKEMIDSVKAQTYSNWELCLSDGSGIPSPLEQELARYTAEDSRIKVVSNETALQISENTNKALEIATGDWIAFMDHDDLLTPDALYECVKLINKTPDTDMIYTDEDKISMDGLDFFQPHFKSDFNIDMLRGTNYFCHFTTVRKDLYEKAGMLNGAFDGAQDYDFVLRCVEHAQHVMHIPKVLYHWRAHKDSTAENPESKLYAFEAGAKVVQAHYDRIGIPAKVESTKYLGIYRSKYQVAEKPLISIIIPNKDHTDDLDKCIRSIEEKSTYKNVEYIIVENNSENKETFEYYDQLQKENSKVKVVTWDKEFNYSAINNYGVSFAKGDYYLFLNNDTEIINEDCLEELMGYCQRTDVGIVGARLFYEDGTIQHAGVIIGLQGVAGHAFAGQAHESPGYFGRAMIAHDLNAVTAACMLVKKEAFEAAGGFDPELAVAFNDIDFCLQVRKAGYLVVYNPYAELYHYESKSRGIEDSEKKVRRFMGEIKTFHEKWFDILEKGDPYYNPNLTLTENNFDLRQ